MVIRIEIITPTQRAELEAALRPYEHEMEPDWIEPPDYFRRMLEAMFGDPDRWLWWAADESGKRVGFAIFRKFRDWPDDTKWVGSAGVYSDEVLSADFRSRFALNGFLRAQICH